MNGQFAKKGEPDPRPSVQVAWVYAVLVLCLLVAAAELLWGGNIFNWLERGRPAHERAEIIASYRRAAETGSLPQPAHNDAFQIYYLEKSAPYRMAVRVRTESGETRQFQLVRPREASGTNWGFRVEPGDEWGAKQTQEIIASYYRRAAGGIVPMPAATNAIKVFRAGVLVTTESGQTNWFSLVRPLRSTGTNWGFNPR